MGQWIFLTTVTLSDTAIMLSYNRQVAAIESLSDSNKARSTFVINSNLPPMTKDVSV